MNNILECYDGKIVENRHYFEVERSRIELDKDVWFPSVSGKPYALPFRFNTYDEANLFISDCKSHKLNSCFKYRVVEYYVERTAYDIQK